MTGGRGGWAAGAVRQSDIDVRRAQRVVFFFFFLSVFFLLLPEESDPKKRNKPIREEMRVGRGVSGLSGGRGGRKDWGDERRRRRSGC